MYRNLIVIQSFGAKFTFPNTHIHIFRSWVIWKLWQTDKPDYCSASWHSFSFQALKHTITLAERQSEIWYYKQNALLSFLPFPYCRQFYRVCKCKNEIQKNKGKTTEGSTKNRWREAKEAAAKAANSNEKLSNESALQFQICCANYYKSLCVSRTTYSKLYIHTYEPEVGIQMPQ